jgi:hypothetical protein
MPIATLNLNQSEIEEAVKYWLARVHDFDAADVTFGQTPVDRPGEEGQFFADAEGKHKPMTGRG